jgi:2-oxoglutarate ferredoxin oxidoreductase subunit delta
MSDQPKTYIHVIRRRYCKGCGICVAFCPKKVLALNEGKVAIERPELCIGCRFCELRCPDYAIEVQESDGAQESGRNGGELDFSIPPEAMHD